jgi:hypothetical protein
MCAPGSSSSERRVRAYSKNAGLRTGRSLALPACWLLALFLNLWLSFAFAPMALASPAGAFSIGRPPLRITVMVGPRNDFCYSDHIDAVEKLARTERDRINKAGGIGGRPVDIQFRNDEGDARKTVAIVDEALADPNSLALIGLQNSDRAREVFKALGPKISESGLPWISSISTTGLFAGYPNVFTMRGSQEEESIPVIAELVKERKFQRPAFVGLKGQPGIEALMKGLEEKKDFPAFVDKRLFTLPGADGKARLNARLDPSDITKAVDGMKAANPDLIFLSVGGWRVPAFLNEMEKAGVSAPVFVSGRIEDIFRSPSVAYSGDVYQIARDELPNLYNNRVRKRLFRDRAEAWDFREGARNQDAFDRLDNGCQERSPGAALDVLTRSNLRAVGIGLEHRDMIAMLAGLLNATKPAVDANDVASLRKSVIKAIPASFSAGKGVYKGSLEDWAFRPASRSTVRAPFIVARPKELKRPQLAPTQYVPMKDDKLRKIPTFYLDIDLIRLSRIDDTEKSFYADFYLSMNTENNPSPDMIDFANAFLDYKTNGKQVTIQPLHEGEESDTYPNNMKIYMVSGKFMLDPNYKSYPFDVQRFTVELRPKKGENPFIVQPLQRELRDRAFETDGWDVKDTFVSYDQDSISIFDTKKLEPSVAPFYKSNFVWVMKRSATDFYLRVVIPLFFIAIVAYLAIFISNHHFEAIVTIQVTAFLSAVALYITTPKVDSDTATLLDRIFVFNYMMFSLMIGISILRVNKFISGTLHLRRALAFLHVGFIPLFLAMMIFYVYGAGGSDTQSELEFWPAVEDGVQRFLLRLGL